jgi:hypothetical protein
MVGDAAEELSSTELIAWVTASALLLYEVGAAEYDGAEDSLEVWTGAASEELELTISTEEAVPVTVTVFLMVVVIVTSEVQVEVISAEVVATAIAVSMSETMVSLAGATADPVAKPVPEA